QAQQQSVNHWEAELSQLEIQTQALLGTLEKKAEVDQCLETLNEAKEQLRQLDKKEADSAPLRQRLTEVQGQIAQVHTRLLTKIELLDNQQTQMTAQHLQPPQLMQAVMETEHKLAHLEKRRDYQEAVRQKGIERRSFMERLQANQLNHEVELAQLDQRLQLLSEPDGAHCPLCEQALVEETRTTLQVRTAAEKDEIQNQIWTIREQLAVSESEIQVLRREYRVLEDELAKYAPILEERGQLKAKLASVDDIQGRLQVMTAERSQLERCLQENDYAADLQGERQQIEAQLAEMAYDDRDHALVRSQVDRLRWSEIKRAEIKKAERQLAQIREQQPELEDKIQAGRAAIAKAQSREDIQRLQDLEQCLHEMDYSLEAHDLLRAQLRDAREWETRYQQLQQATEQKVVLGEKREQLQSACDCHEAEMKAVDAQVEQLKQQLASSPEAASKTTCKTLENEIVDLEDELVSFSEKREQSLAQLGRLQQQLSQLETLEEQQQKQQKNLADTRHKYQVYRSLAEAFGRNGIQALMIENLLPQLEAMTNQVLGRLSNHQLHVQFVTQRAGRKKNKLIDTLDILIADVRGTRPYETYSGGEAFRVNFAIRLAIARLLAMRSGTALQMLIVDEGFGTQDREGCDRLIAAIEAIAPDFACILTITHMPHFREAFQTRIDVSKDEAGSHIMISA
ncbi:MAG: SbcC/MukB-like Walker B domain-containing protein, partial [Cyanobacteria bacterium J06598_1]